METRITLPSSALSVCCPQMVPCLKTHQSTGQCLPLEGHRRFRLHAAQSAFARRWHRITVQERSTRHVHQPTSGGPCELHTRVDSWLYSANDSTPLHLYRLNLLS